MSRQCVVAVYESLEAAQKAVHALDESKFPSEKVSLVANSIHQDLQSTTPIQYGDEATHDAAFGAGVGGLLAFFMAAPLLTIPGIGLMLIAGPISAGLAGAIVGGFLGALNGWGVHEDHITDYEEEVRKGACLVVANGDPYEIDYAKQILGKTEAKKVSMYAHESADEINP
ncbi:hypothetical protein DTL21_01045 [Bremerella cremea]|uniref:General stress protein 17M-like domain-containing protein n=1 Tax=Blastopirellula marina TaxID=124 RepID=A0A2S8G7W3_9BACT|nr:MULTISPECIES: hypothetical protein [Pirellulaceae]PQO40546.1 hypothetical protein C5Y83_01045 [Blastopirellula marina]RCS52128.1 hypothetical protein DTL21_01045 [Bremerella cremea]